jgi:hypothetical protein
LKARVSPEIKHWVRAVAKRELLTEAAWLKRLVIREIRATRGAEIEEHESHHATHARKPIREASGRTGRPMMVRLRHEDRLLLDARAEARGMRPATYASVLIRAHLRKLAPLPKDELLTLKRSIGELAAVGRNLNQIARTANERGRLPSTARAEFRAMLKVCEALRDSTKSLLKANITSWESGYGEDV